MNLTFRAARADDFETFYRACYVTFGYGDGPRANVRREWSVLMQNPTTLTMVVEDRDRPPDERGVAVAQSVFVTDAFVQHIRSGAAPYVNIHATSPLPDESWPLLTPKEVRAANSGEGLNGLLTYYGWAELPLNPEEAREVREYLARSFATFYLGYQFKELLVEVVGDWARQGMLNAGYRLRTDYAAYYRNHPPPPPPLHPYLLGVTRDEAAADEGSYISRVFLYRPPRFFFKPHEQEVLQWAVWDKSDEEMAAALYISPATVKKRWMAIYDRVKDTAPGMLPDGPGGKRGPEKRTALIRYLRDHPEELRSVQPPSA